MTIAADNTKNIANGNDVATVFNFTFKINFSTDLVVVKTDASDVETVLTEGVHYSVTGVGADNGGSITYPLVGDPLPTGEKITMYRVPAIKQLTDLINQGGYYPQTVENALDLLTMIAQMTNEAVNRSIKLDVSDESGADLSVPSPVAGTVLGWNSTADALENISPGSVALALPASDSIVASMINAAGTQATLDKLLSSNIVKWHKGADIPSAAALALGSDGNIFDVTGTTAITSIGTVGVGTLVILQFDGSLTLTHHATDLILPGGEDIITSAGDTIMMYEYAAGDWRCLLYTPRAGTYTLTPNAISNVASFGVIYYNDYKRIDNRVYVTLRLQVIPTAGSTNTAFRVNLPIPSNIGGTSSAAGHGVMHVGYNPSGIVWASADSTDAARVDFYSLSTLVHDIAVSFSYEILP